MTHTATDIRAFIVSSPRLDWCPLVEQGVDTTGLFVKVLRRDPATGRPPTFLLRFEPGARYPYHSHPAGEELFVLDGSCTIEGEHLSAGDYLYTPPGGRHAVRSDAGCTLLFMVPQEVEIVSRPGR